jgi:hypothetical protein
LLRLIFIIADLSVTLCDNHANKTGAVAVRLVKEASPDGRKENMTAADIPRELPPELTAPIHVGPTTRVKQVVGYSQQSVNMEQVMRLFFCQWVETDKYFWDFRPEELCGRFWRDPLLRIRILPAVSAFRFGLKEHGQYSVSI